MRYSLAAALVLSACSPSTTACTPGASVACVGPGGCSGGQVCRADGSGYESCVCGTDAGTDGGGGGGDTMLGSDTPAEDAPDPMLICDSGLSAASPACAACLTAACCAQATACFADSACLDCLSSGAMPGCTATLDALLDCTTSMCPTDCPMT